MRLNKNAIVAFALTAIVSLAMVAPASAVTATDAESGFSVTMDLKQNQDGRYLEWHSENCKSNNVSYTLKKKNSITKIPISGVRKNLEPGDSSTYVLTGACDRSAQWLNPLRIKVEVDASQGDAGQPETPAQPGNTDMQIVSAAFSESPVNRTLSWNVTGCSVLNAKSVAVEVWFNGHQAQVQRASRKEENVNASQWPTGPYKIVAKCKSLADGSVLQTLEQDLELTRANLPNVFAWDRQLNYLIPRPGDRLHISSYPTHNALVLKDGTLAEPFLPNEEVKISYLFDDKEPAIEGPTLQADANGHVETNLWIPLKDGVKNFQILAVGQKSKRQLDYKSVLAPTSGYGVSVEEVANQPLSLRVTSHKPDDMNTETVVEKNREISIEIVGPDDTIVKTIQVTTNQDGTLDTTIELPAPVAEGRYTVLVPTVLKARGHYAAHFYAKNGKLWPQWEEPSDADGDGVADEADQCAGTPAGATIDEHGCSVDPTVGDVPKVNGEINKPITDVTVPIENPGKATDLACSATDLPAGLTIKLNDAGTACVISGTPTSATKGEADITVTITGKKTDKTGTDKTVTVEKTGKVNITPKPAPGTGAGDGSGAAPGAGDGSGAAPTKNHGTKDESLKAGESNTSNGANTASNTAANTANSSKTKADSDNASEQVDNSMHLAKTGVNTAPLLALFVLFSAAGFTLIRIRRS